MEGMKEQNKKEKQHMHLTDSLGISLKYISSGKIQLSLRVMTLDFKD